MAGAARRKEMQKVVVKAARGVALFYTSCQAPGRSVHWATLNPVGEAVWRAGRACLHGATHRYSGSRNSLSNLSRVISTAYGVYVLGTIGDGEIITTVRTCG